MTYTPNIIGVVDPNNTTNTLGGAGFIGTWTDVSKYDSVSLFVNSTTTLAINALKIQFSPDQDATDAKTFSTTIYANVPYTISYRIPSKYYRVTCDGSAATFYLQSSLKLGSPTVSIDGSSVSSQNSTTAPIITGETFNGNYEDVSNYSQIFTNFIVSSITPPTTGNCTFYMYLSSDGVVESDTYGPYILNLNEPIQQVMQPSRKYYKIRVINTTNQTLTTNIETTYMQIPSVTQLPIQEPIYNATSAITTKSVLYAPTTGTTTSTLGAYYQNTSISNGNLNVAIQEPVSAFGEASVINMSPVAQVSFTYNNLNPQSVTTTVGTNGSVTVANKLCTVTALPGATSYAIIQTKRILIYRSGQGSMARLTGIFTEPIANTTQLVGVGNFANGEIVDGFFFGYIGTSFGILFSSSSSGSLVNTFIPQADWNVDNFNGTRTSTNPSGSTINPTKGNVYQIKYQYLGFGSIKFYVENSVGLFSLVHVINYTNANLRTNVSNANMTGCWYAKNTTGTTGPVVVQGASVGLFVEGIRAFTGPRFAYSITSAPPADVPYSIFSLRCNSTINSVVNYSDIRLTGVTIAASEGGNTDYLVTLQLILNATGSAGWNAGNWTTINTINSIASTNITDGRTAPGGTTGGIIQYNCACVTNSNFYIDLSEQNLSLSPGDIMTFAVTIPHAGVNTVVGATWVEDT
jgi:hypothetical protein